MAIDLDSSTQQRSGAWPAGHNGVADGRPTARGGTATPRPANGDVGPLRQMPAQADYPPHTRRVVAPPGDERPAPQAQQLPPRNSTNSMNGSTIRGRRRTAWQLLPRMRSRQRKRRPHLAAPRRVPSFWPDLLQFVHTQRYVLGEHVRDRFAGALRSERTTRRHLQQLVGLGYLGVVGPRAGSPQNVPNIFFATERGLRFVERHLAEQGVAWRPGAAEEHKAKGKSLEHLLHEVLLSQFGTDLYVSLAARPDLRLLLCERRWFRHPLTFASEGATKRLVPDLGYVLAQEQPDGHSVRLQFVELDLGTLSVTRWREKLEAYRQWAETAAESYLAALARHWNTGHMPWRLVVIAHDRLTGRDTARLRDLMLAALELPSHVRRNLWFTTGRALDRHADEYPPLSAACWLWLKDAPLFLDEFQRATAHVPRGLARMTAERRMLARCLQRLPRYTLLPPQAGADTRLRSGAAGVLR